MEVWKNEKRSGTLARRLVFPQLLEISQTSTKHGEHFSISLRKFRQKKNRKQVVYFDYQNVNSLCSHHHYVNSSAFLWSYRNTILNQSARRVFSLGYFPQG